MKEKEAEIYVKKELLNWAKSHGNIERYSWKIEPGRNGSPIYRIGAILKTPRGEHLWFGTSAQIDRSTDVKFEPRIEPYIIHEKYNLERVTKHGEPLIDKTNIQIRHPLLLESKNELQNYIGEIFPNIEQNILKRLILQLDQELKHVKSLTTETFSGAVGQITFKENNKAYVFKIYNKKHIAYTEFKIGQEISKDEELQLVCSKTIFTKHQKEPIHYEGHYLILTEDLRYKPLILSTREANLTRIIRTLSRNYLKEEILHKIYVIALFHSRLKHLLQHEKLKEIHTREEFFSFEIIETEIKKEIPEAKEYLKEVKHIYKDIVSKHRTFDKTVFSHNDPKWDNFINGHLIDFGSAHASSPHADLARILIFEAYRTRFNIDGYISAYIFFRTQLDHIYRHSADVRSKYDNIYLNTYERIISESLRLSKYKSALGEHLIAQYFIIIATTLSKRIYTKEFKTRIQNILEHHRFEQGYSAEELFNAMKRKA